MRPSYLTGSFALHLGAVAAFAILSRAVTAPMNPVYTIDFVGPSAPIVSQAGAAAPAAAAPAVAAAKPQPLKDFDEFGRRKRRKGAPLPRPSLLRGLLDKSKTAAPARESAVPSPAAAAGTGAGPPGEAGVVTDMPNFPYPWYISQVRAALWSQWAARMPKEQGECVVVFALRPNGSIVDLRTEVSSGDASFDLTALAAAQDAAPFPPLPRGFKERFLKIHVTLRSQ